MVGCYIIVYINSSLRRVLSPLHKKSLF